MKQRKPIRVWRFQDAPKRYRISQGGDEDWVAFVPDYLCDEWIPWLEMGSYGCCRIEELKLKNGKLKIGTHA